MTHRIVCLDPRNRAGVIARKPDRAVADAERDISEARQQSGECAARGDADELQARLGLEALKGLGQPLPEAGITPHIGSPDAHCPGDLDGRHVVRQVAQVELRLCDDHRADVHDCAAWRLCPRM